MSLSKIRAATAEDSPSIATVYNHYILHSHSTFEVNPIDSEEMGKRIEKVQREYNLPWLVIEVDDQLIGYAYATIWKPRQAYRNTVEVSIYLATKSSGKGLGNQLYQTLIDELKSRDIHAVLAGISLPNDSSIKFHERLGFQKVGQLKEVGLKFDRWIDVGYWELIFK